VKTIIRFFVAVGVVFWVGAAIAAETRVIINLSEQRAYLIEHGKMTLISPISSGRHGWQTPTGNFSIFSKDIDHRSRSFGSIVDAAGSVINSNATPGSHVPRGGHFRCAPMPHYMEFSPAVGMHGGYLPGYPASHGCVRMPRDIASRFFQRVHIGTPVMVVGSTRNLARVRKAIPMLTNGQLVLGRR
jgi:lipoprotein-anchoring transpeptidase ErfK/SrfK